MKQLIARLRELEVAATPGEWKGDKAGRICDFNGEQLIDAWRQDHQRDVHFIAEMRNALPQLLDRLEKLERLREVVDYSGVRKSCQDIDEALAALEEK